ncbi:MAG: hypothetical protein RPR91_05975 [Colwellia sp.]
MLALIFFIAVQLCKKKIFIMLMSLIGYYLFSDYILFMAGYDIGELALGKMYVEIIFLLLFFTAVINYMQRVRSRRDKSINLYELLFIGVMIFLPVLLMVLGAVNNGLANSINGWRAIFLPIVLVELILFIGAAEVSSDRFWNRVVFFVIYLSLFNSVYAIFQYITYSGYVFDSWRYDLLLDAREVVGGERGNLNEHFLKYQIERNENLRSSGFMVSALTFGYFTALALVFSLRQLLTTVIPIKSLFWLLISICLLGGVYVSQVRTALIISALGLGLFFWIGLFKPRPNIILAVSLLSPLVVVAGSLFFASYLDPSSQGRIVQYSDLLNNFSPLGYGLGSYLGQFDSYYIHIFMTLGLFAFIPLGYFVIKLKGLISVASYDNDDGLLRVVLALSMVLFTVFFVQHIASSLYYFCSILFITGIVRKKIGAVS